MDIANLARIFATNAKTEASFAMGTARDALTNPLGFGSQDMSIGGQWFAKPMSRGELPSAIAEFALQKEIGDFGAQSLGNATRVSLKANYAGAALLEFI